jgi:predicted nucleic acid-binding protein
VGQQVIERVLRVPEADDAYNAPYLIDIEVAQTLRKLLIKKKIDEEQAGHALEDFEGMPIKRYEHVPMLMPIWQLRSRLSAYDATYVSLARRLNAPLLTCDRGLWRSQVEGVQIEYFPPSTDLREDGSLPAS